MADYDAIMTKLSEVEAESNRMADNAWMLQCAYLVFFMQLGFTVFEVGACPGNLSRSIIYKNMIDLGLTSIGWYVMGFGLSSGGNGFIGNEAINFAPQDTSVMASLVFGWGFCAAASTIDSGASVGRIKFAAYLVNSALIACVVYPIVAYWVWAPGAWLNDMGFVDFAGSTAVHCTGGFSSLALCLMLGPRHNRWTIDSEGKKQENFRASSVVLTTIGTWMLAFGWFGFNSGSTFALSGGMDEIAALVAVNTLLALGSSILAMTCLSYAMDGRFAIADTCGAMLCGLVTITAGAATAHPVGAIAAGVIAAVCSYVVSKAMIRLNIDDPVDAFAVHGVGGVLGTVLVPVISNTDGFAKAGYDKAASLSWGDRIGVQLLGCFTVSVAVFIIVCITMWICKHTIGIRVSAQEELVGLDVINHEAGVTFEERVRAAKMQMQRQKAFERIQDARDSKSSQSSGRSSVDKRTRGRSLMSKFTSGKGSTKKDAEMEESLSGNIA